MRPGYVSKWKTWMGQFRAQIWFLSYLKPKNLILNPQWPTCDLPKLRSVWLAADADLPLPLCKYPELKINKNTATSQSRRHKQAARCPFCCFLCVSCFYWGFRPFHGRNKDIRTCYNIPPHTPHKHHHHFFQLVFLFRFLHAARVS